MEKKHILRNVKLVRGREVSRKHAPNVMEKDVTHVPLAMGMPTSEHPVPAAKDMVLFILNRNYLYLKPL
jgi:hypothetical protein